MLHIQFQNACYLCGNPNVELGNICIHCKDDSSFISSKKCPVCGLTLISENNECLRCRNSEFIFRSNRSIFEYKNTAKEIFYQYKFKKHKKIGLWYATLLYKIIHEDFSGFIIVPSPYRFYKKINKGWDQVEYISKLLKNKYHLPVYKVLKRKGKIDQKKLDIEQRKMNLDGCILFNKKYNISNKKILFIDDVFTTGATANECSKILLKNNAQLVSVLTIAID